MPIKSDNIWRGRDQRGQECVEAKSLDDLRQKEAQAVIGRDRAEIDQAQADHASIEQRLHDRVSTHRLAPAPLRQERFGKPVALIGGEPCGIGRPIGQIEEDDAGENDGGDGLDDEKPLPTGKAEPAMEIEQQAGNRGADHGEP
jgi:hypothetical protein